jgi:hypothetical protein
MRFRILVLLVLSFCLSSIAQDHSGHSQANPATLMPGLGNAHHPVSTSNPEAQQFFDQGLRLIYDFNHDEAARSFQRATELDPKLAIAYWGIAEAVDQTTTIQPAKTDSNKRTRRFRRRSIFPPMPHPASGRTFKP